jgi:hemoglobin
MRNQRATSQTRQAEDEHASGDEALHRLEELFYEKALADPVLKTLFTKRAPPPRRSPDLVHCRILRRPRPVHPQPRLPAHHQRERFIAVYLEALDKAGLPGDEPFRRAVREHVEFGDRRHEVPV